MRDHRPSPPRRNLTAAVVMVVMVVSLAACGPQTAASAPDPSDASPAVPPPGGSPATPPPGGSPATPPPGGSPGSPALDPAGGTRPAAISPSEALELDEPMPLVVRGTLHVRDGDWRLCGVLLESLPPQCPEEEALMITNPEAIPEADRAGLREAEGIRWGEEMVVYAGERRGAAGFHVTGPPDAEGLVGGDAVPGDAVKGDPAPQPPPSTP